MTCFIVSGAAMLRIEIVKSDGNGETITICQCWRPNLGHEVFDPIGRGTPTTPPWMDETR